jgi:hypothetical protein
MGKKDKTENHKGDSKQEEDEFSHLTLRDYEDELEHRQYSMFWDSLDLGGDSWVPLIKLFCIRLAYIMTQVHLMKHPDEIQ